MNPLKKLFLILIVAVEVISVHYCLAATPSQRVPATILRVVDGDSLKVKFRGSVQRVRLIGIDAPESSANEKAWRDAARSKRDIKTIINRGLIAKDKLQELIRNCKRTELELDVQQYDHYGRLLAYLYIDGVLAQEKLLESGVVSLMTVPPNLKYVALLKHAAFLDKNRSQNLKKIPEK